MVLLLNNITNGVENDQVDVKENDENQEMLFEMNRRYWV